MGAGSATGVLGTAASPESGIVNKNKTITGSDNINVLWSSEQPRLPHLLYVLKTVACLEQQLRALNRCVQRPSYI